MEVEFSGVVAKTPKIKYAVKYNNNANIIVFKIAKNQDQIILNKNNNWYVKIQSCTCEKFFDKDPRAVVTEDTNNIYVAWTMLRKHTQFKNINVQVQYEVPNQDIVWQTGIVNIDLFGYIPADEEIENLFPSILTLMREQLEDHERRIEELEEGQRGATSWGQITGNIADQQDLMDKFDDVDDAIGAEEGARIGGDEALAESIGNEATARQEADAYLQEQIDNIQPVWGNITGDIEDQTDLYNELQDIREVAEGKTTTYIVDTDVEGNEGFKSDDLDIFVTSFTDIDGNVILTNALKKGDAIFTKNTLTTTYKDRWLIDPETGEWSILSADSPEMENYYTKDEADALFALQSSLNNYWTKSESYSKTEIDNLLNNYYDADEIDDLLEEKANDDEVVHLTGEETLTVGANSAKKSEIITGLLGMDAPSSTTLTDEQYNKIVKQGAVIQGTFLGYANVILSKPCRNASGSAYWGTAFYGSNNNFSAIGIYNIQTSTKQISISKNIVNYHGQLGKINISFNNVNGKDFPAYSKGALYYNGSRLEWNDNLGGGLEFDPTKYIIKQGSKFVQVDEIPQDYTGLGYQFAETGLQVLNFRNGEDTGVTASYENDTIALANNDGHSMSMNSNTGKILIDSDQTIVSNNVAKVIKLTQQEYDDLETKDSSTLYIIVG